LFVFYQVHGVCVDKDMGNFYQILGQQLDHFVHELVLLILLYYVVFIKNVTVSLVSL